VVPASPSFACSVAEKLYLATVLPGLEAVAAGELAAKLPAARLRETGRGRILFASGAAAVDLLRLRTIDNLYLYVGETPAGPHRAHLPALAAAAASLVGPAVDQEAAAFGVSIDKPATIWVNASRVGRQTYSRFEAAGAVGEAILRRLDRWRLGTAEEHGLEFRLDVQHDVATLSLRLTPATFRFRGDARRFSAAALRPPVAHALVWLSQPQQEDVFLDPFCGSGTILGERAVYPAQRLIGGDVSAAAIDAARENVPPLTTLTLSQWNARDVPLESHSVSAIVTNLPFGRQVLSQDELPALYLAFARQAQRLLVEGGTAVVLTDQVETLLAAVERTRLRSVRELALSLKGTHPEVVRLSAA